MEELVLCVVCGDGYPNSEFEKFGLTSIGGDPCLVCPRCAKDPDIITDLGRQIRAYRRYMDRKPPS